MTTTTKSNSANTMDIVFRNKFKALLNDNNCSTIMHTAQHFLTFNVEAAFKALWLLTSNPAYQLSKFELTEDLFPSENAISLRNELRYQYELRHPHFMDTHVPETCCDAFDALKKKTDIIVATRVYQQCFILLYLPNGEVERVLFLLSHSNDKFYYGGIRTLGFSHVDSNYLKPFCKQIHDLLQVMLEDKLQQESSAQNSAANRPFANLDALVAQAGMELASCEQATDTNTDIKCKVASTSTAKSVGEAKPSVCERKEIATVEHSSISGHGHLTAEEILSHAKLFNALLCSDMLPTLLLLRDSGFDLNEIIEKEVRIRSLLQVASDLSL